MVERRLEAEGEQHDPGDEGQVEVAVGVQREPMQLEAPRLDEPSPREDRCHIEVEPPERRDDHDPERCPDDDSRLENEPRPDAYGDDRLAERDEDDQTVPLGEVLGCDPPASSDADDDRAEVVDRERDDPDDDSRVPVEEARDDEERRADQGRGREPKDRAAAFGIVASHDPGENEVKRADEEVRDGEQQRVVSERPGNRERDEEHRPGRCEHDESHTAFVDIGRARQPGVGLPRPPDRGEDEHPAENARPRRLVGEQPRYLRDREHERQVEEQLERSDLVLGVDYVLALGLGHARTLASEQRPAGAASRQPPCSVPAWPSAS